MYRQSGEYRTLNLQWRKSQNRDKTPLVNRENMCEGGNQLIPENVHTNPTNGSAWPGCINFWRYVASWNLVMHWSLVARLLLYLLIFASLYWLMPVELLWK
jgi:hypothetical protein